MEKVQTTTRKILKKRIKSAFPSTQKKKKNSKQSIARRLAKTTLNIRNKKQLSEPLKNLSSYAQYFGTSYLKSIILPEYSKQSRIPAPFPLPTLACQHKITIPFTTNASGKAAVVMQPWFLSDNANLTAPILINNNPNLDLLGTAGNLFVAYSMQSRVTAADVSAYRLVSASIIVYTTASNLNRAGIIKGGIVTRVGSVATSAPGTGALWPFGDNASAVSSAINNLMYVQTAEVSNGESLRFIYMPFDPTFDMFVKVGQRRADISVNLDEFFWNFYIDSGTASQAFAMDITWNFELEPFSASFTNEFVGKAMPEMHQEREQASVLLSANPSLVTQAGKDLHGKISKQADSINTSFFTFENLQKGISMASTIAKAIASL